MARNLQPWTVMESSQEHDGDSHAAIRLDKQNRKSRSQFSSNHVEADFGIGSANSDCAVVNRTPQDEISQLKAELALAIQSRDSLQTQIEAITESHIPCYFLKRLPLEVRDEIYKLLLKSTLLNDPELIRTLIGFQLSPAILRTCKQIYEEGQRILYGSNTFFDYLYAIRSRIVFSKCLSKSPIVLGSIQRLQSSQDRIRLHNSAEFGSFQSNTTKSRRQEQGHRTAAPVSPEMLVEIEADAIVSEKVG